MKKTLWILLALLLVSCSPTAPTAVPSGQIETVKGRASAPTGGAEILRIAMQSIK